MITYEMIEKAITKNKEKYMAYLVEYMYTHASDYKEFQKLLKAKVCG